MDIEQDIVGYYKAALRREEIEEIIAGLNMADKEGMVIDLEINNRLAKQFEDILK